MSAPIPSSTQATTPATVPAAKPVAQLIHGFSGDNTSASRDFEFGGKKLTITVYFPANCTEEEKNRRLERFSEGNLAVIGNYVVNVLGIGKNSKKHNQSTVNAITFRQDDKGQLLEAEKVYSNGDRKTISQQILGIKYHDPKKEKKKGRYEDRFKALQIIQQIWAGTKIEAVVKEKDQNANSNQPVQHAVPISAPSNVEEIDD